MIPLRSEQLHRTAIALEEKESEKGEARILVSVPGPVKINSRLGVRINQGRS